MIVTSPALPTDYLLRCVRDQYASAPEHTNLWFPQVTQSTYKLYPYPIYPLRGDKPGEYHVTDVNDRILDRWTNLNRAWWIDKPGLNAKFIDEINRRFTIVVDNELDPRYKHKPTIFPRSYRYEIDCMEENRLKLLRLKMLEEEEEEKRKYPKIYVNENDNRACLDWMRRNVERDTVRWQEKPSIISKSDGDDCLRRLEMSKVGQQFKDEACNFYYANYPPPNVKFRPEKFA